MKNRWMALALGLMVAVASVAPFDAQAKRLGSGKSQGIQRTAPATPPTATPPTRPDATPTQAAAAPIAGGTAAAAAAPKRSWMGPLAGLAAGLGIAALFSHLGMGEGLANVVMIALLALVAVVVVRLLMKRFGGGAARAGSGMGMQPALATPGATSGSGSGGFTAPGQGTMERSSFSPSAPVSAPGMGAGASSAPASNWAPGAAAAPLATATPSTSATLPADFDAAGFERIAKMIFIRMQAANDSGDLKDLREFTTPEMFAALRLDLQDRGTTQQRTDVVRVDAQVIDMAQEGDRHVVSVRFSGLIREEAEGTASDFDEVWHLVKPVDDSRNWAIAGIQQR